MTFNEFINNKHVFASKFRKKIYAYVNGPQLTLEGQDLIPYTDFNDIKSHLINQGYKINWDLFQYLLTDVELGPSI